MLQQVSAPLCGVDRPGLEGLFLISAVLAHQVACSLHDPIPGQAAGPRVPSQLGPVGAFRPSELQAERNLYRKVFLDRGSKIGSTPLSLASGGGSVDSYFCSATVEAQSCFSKDYGGISVGYFSTI